MTASNPPAGIETWLLGCLAHDLRTPYSSMIGVLQLICDEADSMPAETRQDFMLDLLAASRRQLFLLDNLAFLSQMSRQTLTVHRSPVQLAGIPELALDMIARINQADPARIKVNTRTAGLLDSDLQLLGLMLANALLFLLGSEPPAADSLVITVAETAPGTHEISLSTPAPPAAWSDVPGCLAATVPPSAAHPAFPLWMSQSIAASLGGSLFTRPDHEQAGLRFVF